MDSGRHTASHRVRIGPFRGRWVNRFHSWGWNGSPTDRCRIRPRPPEGRILRVWARLENGTGFRDRGDPHGEELPGDQRAGLVQVTARRLISACRPESVRQPRSSPRHFRVILSYPLPQRGSAGSGSGGRRPGHERPSPGRRPRPCLPIVSTGEGCRRRVRRRPSPRHRKLPGALSNPCFITGISGLGTVL